MKVWINNEYNICLTSQFLYFEMSNPQFFLPSVVCSLNPPLWVVWIIFIIIVAPGNVTTLHLERKTKHGTAYFILNIKDSLPPVFQTADRLCPPPRRSPIHNGRCLGNCQGSLGMSGHLSQISYTLIFPTLCFILPCTWIWSCNGKPLWAILVWRGSIHRHWWSWYIVSTCGGGDFCGLVENV